MREKLGVRMRSFVRGVVTDYTIEILRLSAQDDRGIEVVPPCHWLFDIQTPLRPSRFLRPPSPYRASGAVFSLVIKNPIL